MLRVKPVIELVKVPVVPATTVLVDRIIVGFWDVLQTIPLDVIVLPPSLVILPPLTAEFDVMLDAAVVEATVGLAAKAAPPIISVHVVPLYTCI